jgi:two-component system cell cycle response regulator
LVFGSIVRAQDPDFHVPTHPPESTVQHVIEFIRQAYKMRESAALRDALTGLWNRVALDLSLATAWQSARRNKKALSLCILDIDGFKTVNDQHGHWEGDALLKDLANHLTRTVRASDIAGRWGGDEFYIVLPDTPLDGARRLAQRCLAWRDGAPPTLSIGVASVEPESDDTFDPAAFIHSADQALYAAKAAGGGQCISLA